MPLRLAICNCVIATYSKCGGRFYTPDLGERPTYILTARLMSTAKSYTVVDHKIWPRAVLASLGQKTLSMLGQVAQTASLALAALRYALYPSTWRRTVRREFIRNVLRPASVSSLHRTGSPC